MDSSSKPTTFGLGAKVLTPVIAVLVTMLALMVWFVDYRITRQIRDDARESLSTYDVVFQTLQVNHLNYLRLRFQSLANEPKNRSAFGTLDFNTIQKQLGSILDEEGLLKQNTGLNENIAFVLFTPKDEAFSLQEPMFQPQKASRAFITASRPNTQRGLHPENETTANLTDTVAVEGRLYNIVSLPVYNPEHILFGVLTVGEEITWITAQEYSRVTRQPIVFIANGKVVPNSPTLPENADSGQCEILFSQLARHTQSDDNIPMTVGNNNFLCRSGHFSTLKKNPDFGYLLFSSHDPSSNVLKTQNLLLAVSLLAMLIGTALVWLAVHKAIKPLRELRDSAEAVGRGDFYQRVPIRSRDECGELATVFNRMTENIQQSQAELQQTVNTLKTTQAQLVQSEKLSAVGEFVAGVAHELNNPLAAVMGFSELLKDADVDEKHRRHLDLIFKSATRCKKIVQSLLSFARRHQPERKPVSVNRLLEDVVEIVAYQLRSSNVELVQQLSPRLPLVLADGHQLQQVFLNLINNARQAIEAHQPSGRITITTEVKNRLLRIAIRDSGPGIAPENLTRIFDPFFTTKEVGKGTGLGLSLCYGLIKEHGGNITVSSQPGAGATFTIELPASDDEGADNESGIPAVPGMGDPNEGAGKKILVVDDEEILLCMVRDDLTRHGYTVVTADNGEAALRELHQNQFDGILCDVKMPGLNGRQLFDWIRTARPALSQRLMFMTGDIINDSLQLFLQENRLVCINKPFVLTDLRQNLKRTINNIR
ncbi:MAG: ATP-binding protein [Verrucomicrobiota bacterium]